MKKFFSRFSQSYDDEEEFNDDYVELDTARSTKARPKTVVRPYTVTEFRDAKEIIKVFRDGKTIWVLNIHPLRRDDMVELKRFINKVKNNRQSILADRPLTIFKANTGKDSSFRFMSPQNTRSKF